jgi:hypothetical protein
MQGKLSVALSGKDATKLLEGLSKDPQLRADDDPSIMPEDQFPSEHHALLQGKTAGSSSDNIITILQWEKQHTPHLSEEQKGMLEAQGDKHGPQLHQVGAEGGHVHRCQQAAVLHKETITT